MEISTYRKINTYIHRHIHTYIHLYMGCYPTIPGMHVQAGNWSLTTQMHGSNTRE